MALVSIGMPVYNGQEFLANGIESILKQTHADLELIISDNASTDQTPEICRSYAEKDSRIRYVRHEKNLGAARNFNCTFEHARGDYFKWAACDDMCLPDYIQRCVEMFAEAPPEVVLCYPKTTLISQSGEILEDFEDNLDIRFAGSHERYRYFMFDWKLCNAVFGLYRREVLAQTGLIGKFPQSDVLLLAHICLLGQIWELPERLFLRRIHQDSSQRANRDLFEIAKWFDPDYKGIFVMPLTRLFFEFMKMVTQTRLGYGDKIRCYATTIRYGLPRYWRHVGGEVKIVLKRLLAT